MSLSSLGVRFFGGGPLLAGVSGVRLPGGAVPLWGRLGDPGVVGREGSLDVEIR